MVICVRKSREEDRLRRHAASELTVESVGQAKARKGCVEQRLKRSEHVKSIDACDDPADSRAKEWLRRPDVRQVNVIRSRGANHIAYSCL